MFNYQRYRSLTDFKGNLLQQLSKSKDSGTRTVLDSAVGVIDAYIRNNFSDDELSVCRAVYAVEQDDW